MHAWFAVFSTIHSRILLTECVSESLYSVQNIAIHRILLIFDSSNTLVYRLGPNPLSHCANNLHKHVSVKKYRAVYKYFIIAGIAQSETERCVFLRT